MMVQPFLPAIQSEGEYSFIFIGGDFCHALVKRAARRLSHPVEIRRQGNPRRSAG
jgi:hypothetical protein